MKTKVLHLALVLSAYTAVCAESAPPVSAVAESRSSTAHTVKMSKEERAYLKAMNAQFEAMTKLAQSHGHDHRLPKLIFVRLPNIPHDRHGAVVASAVATAQGTVVVEKGLESVSADVAAAVLEAVSLWRCEPPTIDGKSVNIRIDLPFEY
ncbi:hypothetical protein DB347_09595 [Opitutaceae bacterium EW11]|nr:hypothetical protein DB347_09595 [Opitutaceae bacterium EW11]